MKCPKAAALRYAIFLACYLLRSGEGAAAEDAAEFISRVAAVASSRTYQATATSAASIESDPSTPASAPAPCQIAIPAKTNYLDDIPSQKTALISFWEAAGGPGWNPNAEFFFSQNASDLGLAGLLEETLDILEATAGPICSVLDAVHIFKQEGFIRPWLTPNASYCDWIGVGCCYAGAGFAEKFCTSGPQSIAFIVLPGVGLEGSIPDIFHALPDLQFLGLSDNPGLVGALPPMPPLLSSKLQFADFNNTGLSQCHDNTWGDPNDCLPNWLVANVSSQSAPAGFNAMLCPRLTFWRPNSTLPLIFPIIFEANPEGLFEWLAYLDKLAKTAGFAFDASGLSKGVAGRLTLLDAPPTLYGFRGCACLVNYHAILTRLDDGSFTMTCQSDVHISLALPVALPVATFGGLVFIVLMIFACVYKRVFRELEANRNARLKGRYKPGTLTEVQSRLLGLPQKELTLCMTDVSGSTALWEWDPVVMNKALAIQEECLRGLLSRHCGHEVYTEGDAFVLSFHDPLDGVRFVIDLQKELLKVAWPAELLQRPQAASVSVPGPNGEYLIFAGLRLRAVLHTGWPTKIEMHQTTRHISYSGPMVELTEALTTMPSGGQCIMSGQTYQRAFPHLQTLAEASQQKGQAEARTTWTAAARLAWSRMFHLQRGRHHEQESRALPAIASSAAGRKTRDLLPVTPQSDQSMSAVPLRTDWRLQSEHGESASGPCRSSLDGPGGFDGLQIAALRAISYSERTAYETGPKVIGDVAVLGDTEVSLTFLDMGIWAFHDFLGSELRESTPGFSGGQQVMPSFLDAPGSQMAAFLRPQQRAEAKASRSHVTIAFCSPCSTKGGQDSIGEAALYQYQSCIRTSLLLLGGYECQEMHGTFMLAFHNSRAATEWAVSAQLCLLRLSTSVGSATKALVARIGIAEGPMIKICPHKATGRADYFGQAVNRAARLREAATPGQIVVEWTMLGALAVQWESGPDPEALSASTQQLVVDNFSRLRDCKATPDHWRGLQETSGSVVRVLHKATSNVEVQLPTTVVNLNAASLGTYLLKGIQGDHNIWRIMPEELEARSSQMGKRSSVRKLQRGKATCVEPPAPDARPLKPQARLLDIFGLPMLPSEALLEAHRPLCSNGSGI
ncbi:hypothetical protein WJX84_008467 [Apatococcus fuscideae]|uniref:Guanylate cyclase domain-containing protein n=1 Tax=Apatococcus fuscideae TaxID=2026836 RepID=A0AAW1SXM0_9CHLO